MSPERYRLPSITPLIVIIELAFVLMVGYWAAALFANPDPNYQLPGKEAEWLTNSAYTAAKALREVGYIPLWQPYLSFGEPLIDNPFSFILNPISSVPSLLYGGIVGIRYSVVLTALLAGFGGWALGRTLGFGSLGRVLLALLCIGKGNMHAMIGAGYFQLGTTQAYFPLIIAGMVGTLRLKHRRYPIVLTAVAFTLMFFGGNIWYTLPMLMSMGLLILTHVVRRAVPAPDAETFPGLVLDTRALKRAVLAGVLTVGLSGVVFVPVLLQSDRIGNHPDLRDGGRDEDMLRVAEQFINGDLALYTEGRAPGDAHFFYSYTAPLWFVLLMFVILPPIPKLLYVSSTPQAWRIIIVGVFMAVFCFMWGSGRLDVLYSTIPFLGQWRFVGRALAVTSFWLAVLLAMRVDGLWRAVMSDPSWVVGAHRIMRGFGALSRAGVLMIVAAASLLAAQQVIAQWYVFTGLDPVNVIDNACATYLRDQNPGRELAIYNNHYDTVTRYIENDIRMAYIAADFLMLPRPSTVGTVTMTDAPTEWGFAWEDGLRSYFRERGYENVEDSPNPFGDYPCLWRNTEALPYAFDVPLATMIRLTDHPTLAQVTPITAVKRVYDRIGVLGSAAPDKQMVITVQETAYPGWQAWIDGVPARVESVGGQLGVVLPPGEGTHVITFQYIPPLLYIGGGITLVTALISTAFLLRADCLPPVQRLIRRFSSWSAPILERIRDYLLNPKVFEKD